MILDVGAGPRSQADYQIDICKFEKTTHVMDAMMEIWPFGGESFDEVRMEQFLEHCPRSVRFIGDDAKWHTHYPLIHCMREAFRVLKRGGILHVSVPGDYETLCQDPTHEDLLPTEGMFNYFCGQWGGNKPGEFVNDSYGINFAFEKIEAYHTGSIFTIRFRKP